MPYVANGCEHTVCMSDCCGRTGYQTVFSDRFAKRVACTYRKRGLDPTERRLVSFLTDRDIRGASVLEIGGGVGEIQIELLSRGARNATNLEISHNYEAEATALLRGAGLADRVQRRFVDIASSPDKVEPADVVVLHRVVCCYPDYERLLGAAAERARRLLVFSHPPRNLAARAVIRVQNLALRLNGKEFRTFAHPPEAMLGVCREHGLSPAYAHAGAVWQVEGLSR
jgi:16S rRNA G966 N2-methylase RsmD